MYIFLTLDDQYQFLDQLPDSCVLQIMESELTKLKQAKQIIPEPKVRYTKHKWH